MLLIQSISNCERLGVGTSPPVAAPALTLNLSLHVSLYQGLSLSATLLLAPHPPQCSFIVALVTLSLLTHTARSALPALPLEKQNQAIFSLPFSLASGFDTNKSASALWTGWFLCFEKKKKKKPWLCPGYQSSLCPFQPCRDFTLPQAAPSRKPPPGTFPP